MRSFDISRLPALHFGAGNINKLWKLAERFGKRVALITGGRTLERSDVLQQLIYEGRSLGHHLFIEKIIEEPSSSVVNEVVERLRTQTPEVVIAIGGGSVLDAGKAISAMLCQRGNVEDYLEGIGTLKPSGAKVPFVAIPTTAGTGSEVTKNAVLSEVGEHGYKKSLRHDNYVPDIALIDPQLMIGCPPDVTARCGMDAFTQLLESFLSVNANPFTDTLALKGLELVAQSLRAVCRDGSDLDARSDMALAAYLSGVTLANAGLGTVHGIAGPFGGFYKVPHGHICSALMTPVNRLTVDNLRKANGESAALKKYARIGRLFSGARLGDGDAVDGLLNVIADLATEFDLSKIDVPEIDIEKIAGASDNKSNPVKLATEEIQEALVEICT